MTLALGVLACVVSALVSWLVCTHWHRALRVDRDFQEQEAWQLKEFIQPWWKYPS